MGHTQMLLAVAGMSQQEIAELEQRLADGEWSTFTPAERTVFAFTRKQATTPWAIEAADVDRLVQRFGRERALDLVWYVSRCHFMTSVADAFQLPLERENVFQPPAPPPDAAPAPVEAPRPMQAPTADSSGSSSSRRDGRE